MYGRLPSILRESKDKFCVDLLCRPAGLNSWSFCALGTVAHNMGVSPAKIFLGLYSHKELLKFCGISKSLSKQFVCCTKCGARTPFMHLPAHNNDMHHLEYKENADELEKAKIYKETTRQQKHIDRAKQLFNKDESSFKYIVWIIKKLVKD